MDGCSKIKRSTASYLQLSQGEKTTFKGWFLNDSKGQLLPIYAVISSKKGTRSMTVPFGQMDKGIGIIVEVQLI